MIFKELCVAGGGPILDVHRFRTSLPAGSSPNKCSNGKKDDPSGRIQTSAPVQNQSAQRSNAMIVDHSIRSDHSISYLAEQLI
jgi:hypothetical protein